LRKIKDVVLNSGESLSDVLDAHNGFLFGLHNSPVSLRDESLEDVDFRRQDLSQISFTGAYLRGSNFNNCNLIHTNFTDAELNGASFRKANLWNTNFSHAHLIGSDFRNSNLSQAKLNDAILVGSDLRKTDICTKFRLPVIENLCQKIYEEFSKPIYESKEYWKISDGYTPAKFIIELSMKLGSSLESILGTDIAATYIFMANNKNVKVLPSLESIDQKMIMEYMKLAKK